MAVSLDLTPSQLALCWLLSRGEHIVPIPGTTNKVHLRENFEATTSVASSATLETIDRLLMPQHISGNRYSEATQAEIDTERFPFKLRASLFAY